LILKGTRGRLMQAKTNGEIESPWWMPHVGFKVSVGDPLIKIEKVTEETILITRLTQPGLKPILIIMDRR
jgi:hypothetical protein